MEQRSINRRGAIGLVLGSLATVGLTTVVASEKPIFRVGAFVSSLIGASMRDTQIGLSLMLDEVVEELGWKIDVTLYDDTDRFFFRYQWWTYRPCSRLSVSAIEGFR